MSKTNIISEEKKHQKKNIRNWGNNINLHLTAPTRSLTWFRAQKVCAKIYTKKCNFYVNFRNDFTIEIEIIRVKIEIANIREFRLNKSHNLDYTL